MIDPEEGAKLAGAHAVHLREKQPDPCRASFHMFWDKLRRDSVCCTEVIEADGTVHENKKNEDERWNDFWSEFNAESMFHSRSWTHIGQTFLWELNFGLLLSLYDVGSDSWLCWLFWYGDEYVKTVPNQNSSYVSSSDFKCHKIGHYYDHKEEAITSYTFMCEETNTVCACFTLLFMLVPAFNLFSALANRGYKWFVVACIVLVVPFPITLLMVKTVALFNAGKEFNSINQMVTKAEARWEASLQFCLQLFIMFTRSDRQPSYPQIASIVISVVMMSKGSIMNFLANEDPLPLGHQILRIGAMFPMHFTNLLFKLGSLSIICALLCFNAVWIYVINGILWFCLWLHPCTRHLTKSTASHVIGLPNPTTPDYDLAVCCKEGKCAQRKLCSQCAKQNMLLWNIAWLLINGCLLLGLALTANLWPDLPIPTLFPFPDTTLEKAFPEQVHLLASFRGISTDPEESSLRLADLPIVQKIYKLNIGVGCILACGVVSLFLIYWQLVTQTSPSFAGWGKATQDIATQANMSDKQSCLNCQEPTGRDRVTTGSFA